MPLLIFLCLLLLTGCSPDYQIIRLESFIDPITGKEDSTYAATMNGMLIPELSIDERGEYPRSRAEAEARLETRKLTHKTLIQEKYSVPNSTAHAAKQTTSSGINTLLLPVTKTLSIGGNSPVKPEKGSIRAMPETLTPKSPVIQNEFAQK